MSLLKRFGLFFVLVLVLTLADYLYLGRPAIGVDDANIFFRYAHNIAGGHGFVFNPGGERVEGFTSLLWVLVCAAFFKVSAHPELPLLILALVLTTLTVTMVYTEVRKDVEALYPNFERKYFLPLYCAFLIAIGPSFIAWSVLSLMENPLWNLLFTAMTILVLQSYRKEVFSTARKLALVACGILLILTRPEGLAWSFLFGILFFITEWKHRRTLLVPVLSLACFAITTAALTYFRQHYFGYPFPNTYYAKVSHNRLYNIKNGVQYAFGFITDYHPIITLLLAVLAVACVTGWRRLHLFRRQPAEGGVAFVSFRVAVVSLVIVLALLIPFTTGGDHFGAYRFYQGILLLFAWGWPGILLLFEASVTRPSRAGIAAGVAAAALFFVLIAAGTMYNVKNGPKTQLNFEFALAGEGREIARTMNAYWPGSKPATGIIAVGGFALKYEGATIDLMGLNNTIMGHSPGDRIGIKNHAAFNKDVFYQLHADLVLPKLMNDTAQARLFFADLHSSYNFENEAMKNIFNDAAFIEAYHPVLMRQGDGPLLFAFASSAFLQRMQQEDNLKISKVEY